MDIYRKNVADAARRRSGNPIYSSSLDHAAVLAEAIFAHATKDVCILCGKLNAVLYGRREVIEAATMFLSTPGRTVSVLVDRPLEIDPSHHPFLERFATRSEVKIRVVPDEERAPYHFFVGDGDCYRFDADKQVHSSIAAFGDSAGGEHISRIFNLMWDHAVVWPA